MRASRNYYEVLGLPRDSTLAQIKRRYKQLVRKYHPDVAATDKETATRLFIQIREAYEVLSDPSRRRSYDAGLDLERERAARADHRPPSSTASTSRAGASSVPPRHQPPPTTQVAQLIKDAQFAFIQRRFHEALSHCHSVLKIDGRNARVYAILGDIYRVQGKPNTAIRYYSYALQYDPADRDSEKKLIALMGKKVAPKPQQSTTVYTGPSTSAATNVIWWGIAFFLIMLIGIYPGRPIPWLSYYIPPVSGWSWNLVGLMAGASAIVGMMLAMNGLMGHPDTELVLESSGGNWAVVPTGIILLVGSGFFFWGAAAFYIVVGFAQGSLSRSVLLSFVAVACITGLSALMYSDGAMSQVVKFGGNVCFMSMLIGWYIGAMSKPLNHY